MELEIGNRRANIFLSFLFISSEHTFVCENILYIEKLSEEEETKTRVSSYGNRRPIIC